MDDKMKALVERIKKKKEILEKDLTFGICKKSQKGN